MLLVGAVDIALGWAWHTVYRARLHWSVKREGALAAATLVALIGAFETVRTRHSPSLSPAIEDQAAPAITATATPTTVEPAQPAQMLPPVAPVETVEALPSPVPVETMPALPSPSPAEFATAPAESSDPIGDKIMERLGDDVATGSVEPAVEPAAIKPAAPKASKKRKTAKKD